LRYASVLLHILLIHAFPTLQASIDEDATLCSQTQRCTTEDELTNDAPEDELLLLQVDHQLSREDEDASSWNSSLTKTVQWSVNQTLPAQLLKHTRVTFNATVVQAPGVFALSAPVNSSQGAAQQFASNRKFEIESPQQLQHLTTVKNASSAALTILAVGAVVAILLCTVLNAQTDFDSMGSTETHLLQSRQDAGRNVGPHKTMPHQQRTPRIGDRVYSSPVPSMGRTLSPPLPTVQPSTVQPSTMQPSTVQHSSQMPRRTATIPTNAPQAQPSSPMPRSTPVPVGTPQAPPPIAPSLILTNCEARFVIPLDGLLGPVPTTLDIAGTSGRKLLHAAVRDEEDGSRILALASVGCEDEPRAIISRGPRSEPGAPLTIYGRNREIYGRFEPKGSGQGTVVVDGKPVMVIEQGDSSELRLTATMPDGRALADARRGGFPSSNTPGQPARNRMNDGSYWTLKVKPGVDAVLIASCMLAVILLRPFSVPTPSSSTLSPFVSGQSPGPSLPQLTSV